jgi:hypothetical protein
MNRSLTEGTRHRKDTEFQLPCFGAGRALLADTHRRHDALVAPRAGVRPNCWLCQFISDNRHITDVSKATPGGRYGSDVDRRRGAGEPGLWGRVELRKVGVGSPGAAAEPNFSEEWQQRCRHSAALMVAPRRSFETSYLVYFESASRAPRSPSRHRIGPLHVPLKPKISTGRGNDLYGRDGRYRRLVITSSQRGISEELICRGSSPEPMAGPNHGPTNVIRLRG